MYNVIESISFQCVVPESPSLQNLSRSISRPSTRSIVLGFVLRLDLLPHTTLLVAREDCVVFSVSGDLLLRTFIVVSVIESALLPQLFNIFPDLFPSCDL